MAFSVIEKLESYGHLITQAEAMRITGRSRTSVWRMMNSGEIPTVTMGGERMIDPHTWAFVLLTKNPMLAEAKQAHARDLRRQERNLRRQAA